MMVWEGQQLKWKKRDGKVLKIGYFHMGKGGIELILPRKKAAHRLRMYGGSYGINKEILDELVSTLAVTKIKVVVDDGKEVLITTPYSWKNRGIVHQTKGYEQQVHLREKDFDKWYK